MFDRHSRLDRRRSVGRGHQRAEAGIRLPRQRLELRTLVAGEAPLGRLARRPMLPDVGDGIAPVRRLGVEVVYCPRVLGQWFDGIRFYAAASSPRRSRRTWAGLR